MHRRVRTSIGQLALVAAVLGGCATPRNYTDPLGPRYARAPVRTDPPRDTLKVVTFNVEWGRYPDRAVRVLRGEPALRDADIVFLQEMDEAGTKTIADSLGLAYVYYPSTLHPQTKRDFGNAVLSRYPIARDRKIVLPHRQRLRHTYRTAVGATIRVGARELRVYSLHLATPIANGPRARREQLGAVLADADSFPRVVLAGDFNSSSIPELAVPRGFSWPTRRLGHTSPIGDIDHVLLKGVVLAGDSARGIVRNSRAASDHRPVWARIVLPADATP